MNVAADKSRRSAVERLERAFQRIRAAGSESRATFPEVFQESARRGAGESDERVLTGKERGSLDGHIISVKALVDVAGTVTNSGAAVLRALPRAVNDAVVVKRLRAAGDVIVGKTQMTELAFSALWRESEHDWLASEKAAIRKRVVKMKRPYLGICLGHQLLAEAIGGQVALAGRAKVGVMPVSMTPVGRADPFFRRLADPLIVLQWYSAEVRSLPPAAEVLAWSDACRVQAFRYGARAFGLQYHVEITGGTASEWAVSPAYAVRLKRCSAPGRSTRCGRDTAGFSIAMRAFFTRASRRSFERSQPTDRIRRLMSDVPTEFSIRVIGGGGREHAIEYISGMTLIVVVRGPDLPLEMTCVGSFAYAASRRICSLSASSPCSRGAGSDANVLMIRPPYVFSEANVDRLLNETEAVLGGL